MTIVVAEAPSVSEPFRVGATADASTTPCDTEGKDIASELVGAAILRDWDGGGNTADLKGPIILRDLVRGLVVGALVRGLPLDGPAPPRNGKHDGSCGGAGLVFVVITALCVCDETSLVGLAGSFPSTRSHLSKYTSTRASR